MNPNPPATPSAPLNPNGSVTELISGILNDSQRLIRQQVEMVRAEFKEDLRRSRQVAQYFGIGIGLIGLGTLLLVIAAVYLLNWAVPTLPLWACWAIVGGIATVAGGIAVLVANRMLSSYNPLPDKSFQALQENVSWIANPQT